MPVLLLGIVQVVLDLAIILVFILALITVSGMIKDFLAENLVDILIEMPRFDYSYDNGVEDGGILYDIYKRQRDGMVWPLILIGGISWLVTGRFGHHIRAILQSEKMQPVTSGIHDMMRPPAEHMMRGDTPHASMDMGRDTPHNTWYVAWFMSLPSRCVMCIIIVMILPPLWDYTMDASGWAASKILNPVYSGDDMYPCPAEWYVNGVLDASHPDYIRHHGMVWWLLSQQGYNAPPDISCMPELRVRYMLEQWGGHTKAIPPPLNTDGSFWDMILSVGDNSAEWMMRGAAEFFINVMFGVIKAQAVILSGTAMIVSNMVVDIGVATMIVFAPIYLALMLIPWNHIGGSGIYRTIRTYGPASLAAAIIYPIEVAVLFAVSSELMGAMLMSEYGSNLLFVWLFGTAIMSMVIAIPIISLGAFAQVVEQVTGKFTSMIQAAQGAVGMGAGVLGARSGATSGPAGPGADRPQI